MALIKLLLLLFAPPVLNWLVGRFWETYRELRLHRFVFWAWVTAAAPAVLLIVTGVVQAVDQGMQLAEKERPGETRPATFDWGNGRNDEASLPDTPSESTSSFGVNFVGFDLVVGRGQYPLRPSYYDPSLCYDANGRVIANTNCDSDPTTMASGDKVADWVGGRNGIYASSCPRRPDMGWQHGTQFTMAGNVYECRDTGGWINCYQPGDYDPALKATAEFAYCWVDVLGEPVAPYGGLITDWSFGTAVTVPIEPLTMETAVSLLYIGSDPEMSKGWHPSAGLPDAQDWTAGCRKPLSSPVPGVATVTHNGDDGLGIGNTMITIEGPGGKITLLHGDYSAPVGSTVVGGVTRIGAEASNGESTDCHSHVILYED